MPNFQENPRGQNARPAKDNQKQDLDRLYQFLEETGDDELVVVFDLGTKAARILIGREQVPTDELSWLSRNAFFNAARVFNLGAEMVLSEALNIPQSRALAGIVEFIQIYLDILRKSGRVRPENIAATGTAVFRWMQNQEDVLEHVFQQTGLRISVLEKKDEAFLSLVSVFYTYKFRQRDNAIGRFGDKDVIFLIDQGGGSTEISYLHTRTATIGALESINQLGTVVLQDNFFTLDNDRRIEPGQNRKTLAEQLRAIDQYIGQRLEDWPGFEGLTASGYRIFAYGMGSAIGSSAKEHNARWTIDDMRNRLKYIVQELGQEFPQVNDLYARISKATQNEAARDLSNKLPVLYGLPAYIRILKKFNLSEIRFAGYGLRYGAYLARYIFKYELDLLPEKAAMQQDPAYRDQVRKEERRDFLATRIPELEKEVEKLMDKLKSDNAGDIGQLKNQILDLGRQLRNSQAELEDLTTTA
ncbi:MAG: hypothetical protein IT260_23470 [Saprospiraceae bacterium]|nr:hypothetical protein [Saprospiraceae bacterium]